MRFSNIHQIYADLILIIYNITVFLNAFSKGKMKSMLSFMGKKGCFCFAPVSLHLRNIQCIFYLSLTQYNYALCILFLGEIACFCFDYSHSYYCYSSDWSSSSLLAFLGSPYKKEMTQHAFLFCMMKNLNLFSYQFSDFEKAQKFYGYLL